MPAKVWLGAHGEIRPPRPVPHKRQAHATMSHTLLPTNT
jgi:hypothetical protein